MESDEHRLLTHQVRSWIARNYPELAAYIVDDLDGPTGRSRPPLIGGYRPDLFVAGSIDRPAIIGEAKTELDFDTVHTGLQLEAYLRYLAKQPSGVLVVSVTWRARRTAKSKVKRLVRKLQPCEIGTYTITDIDHFDDVILTNAEGSAK